MVLATASPLKYDIPANMKGHILLTRKQRIEQLLWSGMSYIDIMELYASMLVRFNISDDMRIDISEQMKLCKSMYINGE